MDVDVYLRALARQWRMVKRAKTASITLFALGAIAGAMTAHLFLSERLSTMENRVALAQEQSMRNAEIDVSGQLSARIKFSTPGDAKFSIQNTGDKPLRYAVEDFWVVVQEDMHHGKMGQPHGRIAPGESKDIFYDPPIPLVTGADEYYLAAQLTVLYGLEGRPLTQILRTQRLCKIRSGQARCQVVLDRDDTIISKGH